MVATISFPGAQAFEYRVGSKAECEDWLEAQGNVYANKYGRSPESPRMTSNREASKWRYRDGKRVIREFDRDYDANYGDCG